VCAQMLNNSPADNLPVCAPPSYLKLGACLRLSARAGARPEFIADGISSRYIRPPVTCGSQVIDRYKFKADEIN
jgi:hypothetical protein